nr:hypothetical protein CFP56_66780 [Quercus suber]
MEEEENGRTLSDLRETEICCLDNTSWMTLSPFIRSFSAPTNATSAGSILHYTGVRLKNRESKSHPRTHRPLGGPHPTRRERRLINLFQGNGRTDVSKDKQENEKKTKN